MLPVTLRQTLTQNTERCTDVVTNIVSWYLGENIYSCTQFAEEQNIKKAVDNRTEKMSGADN